MEQALLRKVILDVGKDDPSVVSNTDIKTVSNLNYSQYSKARDISVRFSTQMEMSQVSMQPNRHQVIFQDSDGESDRIQNLFHPPEKKKVA